MFKLNTAKMLGSGSTGSNNTTPMVGSASLNTSVNTTYTNFNTSLLENMVDDFSEKSLNDLYREIYLYDTVSGPTVDLMANLPWSTFTLTGVKDKSIINIFEDSIAELGVVDLMRQLSVSYLVLGKVIGSLLFNEDRGIFTDIIMQNPDNCTLTEIPLKGYDPKIDVIVSPELKQFLRSKDQRDKEALKEIPNALMVKLLKQNKIELEPLSTLYLNRTSIPGIKSLSYYTRLLPIWLIEKALMRGTIIASWKRQRSILHVTCLTGDTLVSTEKGLIRIDEIIPHNPKEFRGKTTSFPTDLKVKGYDGKFHSAKYWHYRGCKDTISITTEQGRTLSCTPDHKILILNSSKKLEWVEAKDLENKFICIVNDNENYLHEKVIKIDKGKEEHVYDLTMGYGTKPAFIANGIISHNCGSDDWDATDSQLDSILSLFTNADQDPQGAIIATRPGIETNDVRSGSDFWKITDEWDTFSNAKMRALGVNDSFLCLSGDTTISTDRGLITLTDLSKDLGLKTIEKDTGIDIDLTIKGKTGKPVKATKFWYRGEDTVYKILTNKGYNVRTTKDHKILTLGEELKPIWVKTKDLTTNSTLCIDQNGIDIVKNKLKLNLEDPIKETHTITKPEYMTPELAYLLGIIVTDRVIGKYGISLINADASVLSKFKRNIKKVFNTDISYTELSSIKGDKYDILGITGTCKQNTYAITVNSIHIGQWFAQLGASPYKRIEGEVGAYYKDVPWSILQADLESKHAFIAGFIDGDGGGSVNYNSGTDIGLIFYSSSFRMIKHLRVLLLDMGYPSYTMDDYSGLSVNSAVGSHLYKNIQKQLVHGSKSQYEATGSTIQRTIGIPIESINMFLRSRYIGRQQNVGEWFENDKGKLVSIKTYGRRVSPFLGSTLNVDSKTKRGVLPYGVYEQGTYDDLLQVLKQISVSFYKRVLSLFDIKYFFDNVSYVKETNIVKLYDLTIEKTESPAFVANGIIVHNSGDSNFNTQEMALSSFMENLKSFREYMTTSILYDKIFLLTSKYHGFKQKTQAELDHKVNTSGYSKSHRILGAKNLASSKNYIIPKVQWTKDLSARSDSTYMDMLTTAEEKGIPVTIAMFAAAAGVDMDEVMDSLESDAKLRKQIKEYKDKLKTEGVSGGGDEDGDGDMFGSVSIDNNTDNDIKKLAESLPDETILNDSELANIVNLNSTKIQ